MNYAIGIIVAIAIGYGLRWLQVAVRPDVPSTEWQLKRWHSRNRAMFKRSILNRN